MKRLISLIAVLLVSVSVAHAEHNVLWTNESAVPGDASMITGENLADIKECGCNEDKYRNSVLLQ